MIFLINYLYRLFFVKCFRQIDLNKEESIFLYFNLISENLKSLKVTYRAMQDYDNFMNNSG
ncbi:hypothetical protein CNEO2_620018 [Clostridium neonatale]|nr:hypothetical protein CNEO2_620018 [Clostridium neonatale]CAI3630984.1 hypothetical protein CNEO4_600018 [Clostridium neonatale]